MGITLNDVQRGYARWAVKPHNAKWVRKIDGTPIANDIVVNIFNTLRDDGADEAVKICDAVLSWLVSHGLIDAGNEYTSLEVIEALDELAPPPPIKRDGVHE